MQWRRRSICRFIVVAFILTQLAVPPVAWAQQATPSPVSTPCHDDHTPTGEGVIGITNVFREESTLQQFAVPGQRNMLSGRSTICVEAHHPSVEITLYEEGQVMLAVLEGSVTLKVTAACGKYNCDLATSTNPNNGDMRLGALGANQEYIWTEIPTGKQVKLTSANVVTLSDVTVRLTFGDETLGETRTRLVAAGWLPFPQIGGCTAACWHFP